MRDVKRVVVLGANGAMGSGAGALFAARGFDVSMLARTLDKANVGLDKARAAVRSDVIGSVIRCGAYEDDLEREVAGADLVIEAVSEELSVKKVFFERVDAARRPGTIVSTVSSGLSIASMARDRSQDFRRHFMGIHLFNPPMVITGTELIAGPETDVEVYRAIGSLLRKRLGRALVECRDLPAFAGNRIGFKVLNECARLAATHGVEFIDYIVGPHTGRALAPLATIDLVGWDVHRAIVDNIYANTSDEAHDDFALPSYMAKLIDKGHLGDKTGALGGFYRRTKDAGGKKSKLALQPGTGEYGGGPRPDRLGFVDDMKALHREGRYRDAMGLFLKAPGEEAELARKIILGYVSYALHRVGPDEVVDSPEGVDRIMGNGFNWAPPTLLVDLFGPKQTAAAMHSLGIPVPRTISSLGDGDRLGSGSNSNIGRYFFGR
jgi:3-hydroxyacyl-CoA dehydrogenase